MIVLVKIVLVTNIYYCCHLVKYLLLPSLLRQKVYCLAEIGHVVILREIPKIFLFTLKKRRLNTSNRLHFRHVSNFYGGSLLGSFFTKCLAAQEIVAFFRKEIGKSPLYQLLRWALRFSIIL